MAGYYESRKHLSYYTRGVDLVRSRVKHVRSVLDVGANDTPLVSWYGAEDRTTLDLLDVPAVPGVKHVVADFNHAVLVRRYDVVTCFQTLEHLKKPRPFVQKLFRHARKAVLLSVPYLWTKGAYAPHIQDPVEEVKLFHWTGHIPHAYQLAIDEDHPGEFKARLLALYLVRDGHRDPNQGEVTVDLHAEEAELAHAPPATPEPVLNLHDAKLLYSMFVNNMTRAGTAISPKTAWDLAPERYAPYYSEIIPKLKDAK